MLSIDLGLHYIRPIYAIKYDSSDLAQKKKKKLAPIRSSHIFDGSISNIFPYIKKLNKQGGVSHINQPLLDGNFLKHFHIMNSF